MSQDTQLDTLRGTILAVDDSPTIRKLVSMTMEGQGYRVVVAADGIEALAILKDEHPDLILCDVAMPKLDGYQLCKIIKNSTETKHIPVVMLSGKDGLFDKVRGKMSGCANYITKPFEPDILISEVRKYVKPALIPMSPYKPKKKAPEPAPEYKQPAETAEPVKDDGSEDSARALAEHLSGLVMPEGDHAPNTPGAQILSTQNAPPHSPDQVSMRTDDLTPLPDKAPPGPARETPQPAPLSAVAETGTVELDKLLAELEHDDDIFEDSRPRDPFRSRCPGCRTVFKNVRPDDYDKHARCKKCGTRFHLGDNLVV